MNIPQTQTAAVILTPTRSSFPATRHSTSSLSDVVFPKKQKRHQTTSRASRHAALFAAPYYLCFQQRKFNVNQCTPIQKPGFRWQVPLSVALFRRSFIFERLAGPTAACWLAYGGLWADDL
jgi:hypothetical protein